MGLRISKTKPDPSSSYLEGRGDEVSVGLRLLHSGPIHSLCAADHTHLITGGTDEVYMCIQYTCVVLATRMYIHTLYKHKLSAF